MTGVLITTAEAEQLLKTGSEASARKALSRAGISAPMRAPGRGGKNLYLRADVEWLARNRLGRGARTDLKKKGE